MRGFGRTPRAADEPWCASRFVPVTMTEWRRLWADFEEVFFFMVQTISWQDL